MIETDRQTDTYNTCIYFSSHIYGDVDTFFSWFLVKRTATATKMF